MKTKTVLTIALCWIVIFAATLYAGAEAPAARQTGSPKGKMPGKVVLGSLAEKYGPVVFDHGKHVGLAGNCADCHHQHQGGQTPTCGGCHTIDPASFKKNVSLVKIRPCRECHPASYHPAKPEQPTLAAAYHRACIRCHREVGSVGNDPKGCAEMCHEGNRQAKSK